MSETVCLGIDTSNYTTSAALYFPDENRVMQKKRLLPVASGQKGLRQSDAVFHHTVQLPDLIEELFGEYESGSVSCVGVSVRPRDAQDSYMPCFMTGMGTARAIGAIKRVPVYTFSHQAGHIAAALYSADCLDFINRRFIAFHVSGGTTEALSVEPDENNIFKITRVAGSLDLKAGQAVDRVGVMLGLKFPAGMELDRLACESNARFKIKPTVKGADCCLSGIENKCMRMLENGESRQDIARFCILSIQSALDIMAENLLALYGDLPLVFSGGVMSNSMIRAYMQNKYGAHFAQPSFSSDNAAGIALLAGLKAVRK